MSEKDSERSFGDLPTLGHEETRKAEPRSAADGPSWSALGLSEAETFKPAEGIRDDGRTDAARRWKPGDVILDRYVVEGELGQGGMGVVYACLDRVGGVRVAVKCLPPELSHNSVEMEEVRENFRLVCGLRHANIAGVRTLERDAWGEYFLVMDIAEGKSLRQWEREKWREGGISLTEALSVLRQVAAALDYAHGKRIVHRDVKPGNVMIDADGEVKVLDFGLADQIRSSLSRVSHAWRATSGTGPYMAPEQWRGRQQDGKTDQYALGVVAYEMLSGHLPFENSDPGVLREVVLKEEPETIAGLHPSAMAAIRRAMAKTPAERFPVCTDFVDALAGRYAKLAGRKPRIGDWLATLAIALTVGAGAWLWKEDVSRKRLEEAARQAEEQRLAEDAVRKAEMERQAREEIARQAEQERLAKEEADRKAEQERLEAEKRAAEKAAAEKREAEEKAAREQAERDAAESWRLAQEAERRTKAAEAARLAAEEARQKAETEATQRQRELEARLAKLEEQTKPRVAPVPARTTFSSQTAEPRTTAARRAGTTKTITLPGGATMEMVWCPPGSFMMGSPKGERGRDSDESQHQVVLTEGFWIAKHEVTQKQWKSVMGNNPSYYDGDNLPVDCVSWNNAQKFCRKAGNGLRLPTEAEWEYACRAGSTGALAGTGQLEDMAWCGGTVFFGRTHPVGGKKPNAWGLYDMHGNVWEWCEDRYGSYPHDTVTNPRGAESGTRRVNRGGCFKGSTSSCRSAARGALGPDFDGDDMGFRPVCPAGAP